MADNHYVDNKQLYECIVQYKNDCIEAKRKKLDKPPIPNYVGECIMMIAERLSHKPNFINYSFRDEMISDGIENCISYFDNFDPAKSTNPFAYFTQIIYYAFHRRINKEEKNRYIIYKKFQESVLNSSISDLMFDGDGNHVIPTTMYDNINDFIDRFEKREVDKKSKRKEKKEGLEKFVGDENERRESV